MNIYSVYIDSRKKETNPILIKQGFSFFAGIFNFLWAFYHKMWSLAIMVVIVHLVVTLLNIPYIADVVDIMVLFIFAFFASEIREYYASKKGLELSDIIFAHDEEEAEVRYYSRLRNISGDLIS